MSVPQIAVRNDSLTNGGRSLQNDSHQCSNAPKSQTIPTSPFVDNEAGKWASGDATRADEGSIKPHEGRIEFETCNKESVRMAQNNARGILRVAYGTTTLRLLIMPPSYVVTDMLIAAVATMRQYATRDWKRIRPMAVEACVK